MSEIEKESHNTSLFKRGYFIFKTCNLPQKVKLDPISKWLIITRSCVISMAIIAGIIGGLLAIPQGSINWLNWLLSVVGIRLAHWSNNMPLNRIK